ncbi:MAG: hypothetical protein EZS28_005760 [Streblomastix strix]|uniref:Tyr recombinase domain-containing protein n=1 Tax=Streblomastix strix TaxID=222440 RepID=A0A5J4WUL4_9EUKA|nr:MAG: hypothetical protein EZS28_005760 [Streblomastix strix]
MVNKENSGQPTGVIDQQNNNMHVNNRRITTGLGSNTDDQYRSGTDPSRLLERVGSRIIEQRQGIKNYIFRNTLYRTSLHDVARSGPIDTFRQFNSSLRLWKIESKGIPDERIKTNNILEMGQRMKDKDQKLPPDNVSVFLLDLSQTQEVIFFYEVWKLEVKIASLLKSICFFRPNEIAQIRLKFSNVKQSENQASLKLRLKQANSIETYEAYNTDNEKLSPKQAIYERIERLNNQFPKCTDFLLWHKGFNKPTTTKDISLQLTKLLNELKIIVASAYSIRHYATTEFAILVIPEKNLITFTNYSQYSRTVQQYQIFAFIIKANDISRQLINILIQDNEWLKSVPKQQKEVRRERGNQLLFSSLSETRQ